VNRGVDTERDPTQEAILNVVAQQDIVHNGVARSGALGKESVPRILREWLQVGLICWKLLNVIDKILVKVDLPNMCRRRPHKCSVGLGRRILVEHHMDMSRSSGVVPREQRVELGDSVIVCLEYTASKG